MTGNIAFDVVIGVVFVYLLYSLYATISMELITSILGLRAKNLRFTLKRMSCDEKKFTSKRGKYVANIITTFVRSLGFAPNLDKIDLYRDFYNHTSIKNLGSGGFGGKPSYMHAANFSKALIDIIKVDDPDIPIMGAIEIGVNEKLAKTPSVQAHIQSLMRDANKDPVKFKILLENWFTDTMERSSGWFKQTTQVVILFIGIFLVYSFNLDTFAMIRKLSVDKDARAQMVQLATNSAQNSTITKQPQTDSSIQDESKNVSLNNELKQAKEELEIEIEKSQTILQNSWRLPDTINCFFMKREPLSADSLQITLHGKSKIPKDTSERNNKLSRDKQDKTKENHVEREGYVIVHRTIDTNLFQKQFYNHVFADSASTVSLNVDVTEYKLGYIFSKGRFWGYLFTVLALSLGAPFWFDLLNKLIKLRTGKQVAESGSASAHDVQQSINHDILNRVG